MIIDIFGIGLTPETFPLSVLRSRPTRSLIFNRRINLVERNPTAAIFSEKDFSIIKSYGILGE